MSQSAEAAFSRTENAVNLDTKLCVARETMTRANDAQMKGRQKKSETDRAIGLAKSWKMEM